MSQSRLALILALGAACVWGSATLPAQTPFAPATEGNRQDEVRQLIAILQSATASQFEKVQACHRLTIVGTREAVPALAALLSDEQLAHMARYALEPLPDPAADDALRAALPRLQGTLKVGVINSIGVRRDARAVDALIPLLADADPAVATAAAAALGRIGNAKCADALQTALAKAGAATRLELADACLVCAGQLSASKQQRKATALYDFLLDTDLPAHLRMAAMRGAILTRESAGRSLLIEQLQSSDPGMVAIALSVARELPGSRVTKALTAALGSLPEEKQELLLVALGDRADPAALSAVLASAVSGPTRVRVVALQVLATLGNVSVVPQLLTCAGDPAPEVAQAAQATLAALPGTGVDKALVSRVQRGDTRLRLAAIEALGQRRAAAAVPSLRQAASDPDPGIRVAALHALGETVGLADLGILTEALVGAKSPDERSAANEALLAAGMRIQDKPGVAERLLAVLPQAGGQVRGLLLLQLGQVGGAKALQAVRLAAQDPDADLRAQAVQALAHWPDATAAPALAEIARSTSDPALRDAAFSGYLQLVSESDASPQEKMKQLEQAVPLAGSAQDRKRLLAALGETSCLESLRMVAGYLSDPNLVDEAGRAAVKLGAQLGSHHTDEVSAVLRQVIEAAPSKPVLDAARGQLGKLGAPKQ